MQPNPAGGAPLVPQSLNRYAATAVGQPGVGQGSQALHPLFVTAIKGAGKTFFSELTKPARNAVIHGLLASTIGRSRLTGFSFVHIMGEPKAFSGPFASLDVVKSHTYSIPAQGCLNRLCNWLMRRATTYQIETRAGLIASSALDDLPKNLGVLKSDPIWAQPAWVGSASKYGGAFLWGAGLSGLVQYASDYNNPYLTPSQFKWRVRLSALGGGITATGAAWLGTQLGIPGGPVGIALGAGIGFTLGFAYFGFIQPVIFQEAGLHPQRNLAPLSSP